MKTRIIQTRFWDDDIVQSLSKDANHLWIFLLTNKEIGMSNYVKILDSFISEYTKISPKDLLKAKNELETTKKVLFYKGWIYIKNLERENSYQNSPKNVNPYLRELEHIPNDVKAYFTSKANDSNLNEDSSIYSTIDSTHKSEIKNKKSEIRNNLEKIILETYNFCYDSKRTSLPDGLEKQILVRYETHKAIGIIEAIVKNSLSPSDKYHHDFEPAQYFRETNKSGAIDYIDTFRNLKIPENDFKVLMSQVMEHLSNTLPNELNFLKQNYGK